jgi:putative peptidoglycan lipid II flippase
LAIAKEFEEVRKQLIRAIRMVGVVTVPSAVALLFFGPLMTEVLYMGISLEDSRYIGFVLSALSFGLVAFSINLILIRGFNAFEDTKTQVTSIIIINIISVALSYLFLATLDSNWVTVGLGVAFSVSYIVGLFITISLLKKHVGRLQVSEFAGQHGRLFAASLLGMLPFFAIAQYFGWAYDETTLTVRALRLLFLLVASGLGYLFCARFFKVSEIAGLRAFATQVMRRARRK